MAKVLEALLGDFEFLMMGLTMLGVLYLVYRKQSRLKVSWEGYAPYGTGTSNADMHSSMMLSGLGRSVQYPGSDYEDMPNGNNDLPIGMPQYSWSNDGVKSAY